MFEFSDTVSYQDVKAQVQTLSYILPLQYSNGTMILVFKNKKKERKKGGSLPLFRPASNS